MQEFEQILQSEGKDQGLTIYDEKNNIVIEASMPGLKSEEIEINLNKGMLWIKGEKKEEETDKSKKFYKKSFRSYSYNIVLPDEIDENQEPDACYKDGVLVLTFPRAKDPGIKRISIRK
ncbi:MAG: Hsp20/alpha crystallin family protein [Chlamydiales bacterium]|nr:Hsp20/alpha crystallin family protein [Chlamydiales bacterium]